MEDPEIWEALEYPELLITNQYKRKMELNEYQLKAKSTCLPSCDNISYMGFGLSSEVGELHGKIAKAIRKEQLTIVGNKAMMSKDILEDIKAELGDVLWFVSSLADVLGMKLEDVAKYNLDKLQSRKERNVIIGDGDHR